MQNIHPVEVPAIGFGRPVVPPVLNLSVSTFYQSVRRSKSVLNACCHMRFDNILFVDQEWTPEDTYWITIPGQQAGSANLT